MKGERRPIKGFALLSLSLIFLISLTIRKNLHPLQKNGSGNNDQTRTPPFVEELPRGMAEGVSAKSNPSFSRKAVSFNWTAAMFAFQRTAFHFQPEKNWMNDPDGPLFYKGWYHLFYQYNPDSAVWGNITWGHTVSRDLIHWLYLPIAMEPDQWYDINGVWTGSSTILPDGQIVVIYTGDTVDAVQVQNVAYPANLSDPLLIDWVKYSGNPVLVPPTGIGLTDFRDPTTAWIGPDGKWRILIGSKINDTGLALVFKTENFTTYEQSDIPLHEVPQTGMWECVDFYPVSINGSKGLDTSVNGPGVKHVLKASMDDTRVDQYAIGTYFVENDTWVPDDPKLDVGLGLRYDYGRYYASKTFYDQNKERRILWGWVNETDTAEDDLEKGWASIQTIPRSVLFDNKTGSNLLLWPVEEIESLRLNSTNFTDIVLQPGSVLQLDVGSTIQLDIFAEFEITEVGDESVNSSAGCGEGAVERSSFGPFGILVLADETLSELTPIYFNLINGSSNGDFETYLCADEKRSSKATGVFKQVYGTDVPVLEGEKYSMRVLVDHSMVESFAQGGRRVISSRVYPTVAINGAAKLFLFNNATSINVTATLNVWELESADIRPFSLDQFQ